MNNVTALLFAKNAELQNKMENYANLQLIFRKKDNSICEKPIKVLTNLSKSDILFAKNNKEGVEICFRKN